MFLIPFACIIIVCIVSCAQDLAQISWIIALDKFISLFHQDLTPCNLLGNLYTD